MTREACCIGTYGIKPLEVAGMISARRSTHKSLVLRERTALGNPDVKVLVLRLRDLPYSHFQ
jgi:hypothetical protein